MPLAAGRLTVDRIGYDFGGPHSRNLQTGNPTDRSRDSVEELIHLSSGNPAAGTTVLVQSGENSSIIGPFSGNEVDFPALAPEQF
ncbi:MAG: hypothetical protein WBE72_04385 [Terracidiphilus sp.]